MSTTETVSQAGGLVCFALVIAALYTGRRMYVQSRTARVVRQLEVPVPGRTCTSSPQPGDEEMAWLRSVRAPAPAPATQLHDPGEVRPTPPPPVPALGWFASARPERAS